jgi:Methyltransferase FkbM domain
MCKPYDFDSNLAIILEELMQTYELQRVDFVKMDIKGAEFAIFRDSLLAR